MLDKITNKNCKTFFQYFPLFFRNVCLGAQYLDTKLCSLLLLSLSLLLLFLLLLLLLLLFIQKVKLQNNGIFHTEPFEKSLLLYSCISNV